MPPPFIKLYKPYLFILYHKQHCNNRPESNKKPTILHGGFYIFYKAAIGHLAFIEHFHDLIKIVIPNAIGSS